MNQIHQLAGGGPARTGRSVAAFLRSRPLALATALAAPAAGGAGLAYYAANDPGARRMVEVELAGSVGGIERLRAWLPNPGCLRTLTRDGPHA